MSADGAVHQAHLFTLADVPHASIRTRRKAPKTKSELFDVRRFLTVEEFPEPQPRYRVGSGNRRAGQAGTAIASIGFRHSSGYEIVMQMDGSGRQDSFSPMQLFPIGDDE